jgi:hypothetical protein
VGVASQMNVPGSAAVSDEELLSRAQAVIEAKASTKPD